MGTKECNYCWRQFSSGLKICPYCGKEAIEKKVEESFLKRLRKKWLLKWK